VMGSVAALAIALAAGFNQALLVAASFYGLGLLVVSRQARVLGTAAVSLSRS
jgi:hypothetical protein